MKLHYERVWDYDIDEQEIVNAINNIKITPFINLSNKQLRHFSEQITATQLSQQLRNVDVSKLPNQLIKPVTNLIYNKLKERIESA